MTRTRAGVAVFLILTFGLAWAIEFIWLRRVSAGSHTFAIAVGALTLVPALSALVVRVFVERSGFRDAGLRWGRGRYYLWGWFLPIALGWIAMALSLAFRQAQYDPYLAELMWRMQATFPQMRMPPIEQVRLGLILSSLTYMIVPNTIAAFGEEFGWRGYLLMRLRRLGALPAAAVTGAIWGIWYAPLVLVGYASPQHRMIGVPLMVGLCTASGVILGWLRLASGSVFAAAVGRGSFKGAAQTPLAFTTGRNDVTAGLPGIIGQVVMLLVVIGLWRLGAVRSPETVAPGEEDAGEPLPEQVEQ
jgi:CAAX protease family protein